MGEWPLSTDKELNEHLTQLSLDFISQVWTDESLW